MTFEVRLDVCFCTCEERNDFPGLSKCVCSSSVMIVSNDCGNRFSYERVGRVWGHRVSSVVCISFLCVCL